MTNITIDRSTFLMGKLTISMAIFNSYVVILPDRGYNKGSTHCIMKNSEKDSKRVWRIKQALGMLGYEATYNNQ